VGIRLLDFELFTGTPGQCVQALWRFEMRDEATLLKEAREECLQQGLEKGHREGHIQILLQQLSVRFGPPSEAVRARRRPR
jgi:hypothetical protein